MQPVSRLAERLPPSASRFNAIAYQAATANLTSWVDVVCRVKVNTAIASGIQAASSAGDPAIPPADV